MVDRVGEELIQAVDKLPAPMAQRVKGRFISRWDTQAAPRACAGVHVQACLFVRLERPGVQLCLLPGGMESQAELLVTMSTPACVQCGPGKPDCLRDGFGDAVAFSVQTWLPWHWWLFARFAFANAV